KALTDYTQAIDRISDHPTALAGRAVIYGERGEWDRAVADYSKALVREKRRDVLSLRGRAYQQLGQWDKAVADHTEVLKEHPNYQPAYRDLGLALLHIKDGAAADDVAAYRKVAETYSKNPWAHWALGQELLRRGDRVKAIAAFRAA